MYTDNDCHYHYQKLTKRFVYDNFKLKNIFFFKL